MPYFRREWVILPGANSPGSLCWGSEVFRNQACSHTHPLVPISAPAIWNSCRYLRGITSKVPNPAAHISWLYRRTNTRRNTSFCDSDRGILIGNPTNPTNYAREKCSLRTQTTPHLITGDWAHSTLHSNLTVSRSPLAVIKLHIEETVSSQTSRWNTAELLPSAMERLIPSLVRWSDSRLSAWTWSQALWGCRT